MKKYIVFYSAGMCETDEAVGVVAENAVHAVELVTPEAWEHFWNHNEADNWDDEVGSINGIEAELDIWAEEYDPKKHDMKFVGGVAVF